MDLRHAIHHAFTCVGVHRRDVLLFLRYAAEPFVSHNVALGESSCTAATGTNLFE